MTFNHLERKMNWSKKAEPVDEKCTFVKKIPDEFICLICSRLLRDPHVTECCGQHYCQHCLEKWLQGNPKKPCPFCRKENCNYIRYLPMKREIDELKVYCLNREKGCEIISTLNKVSDHILKDCEFETVSCFCGTSLLRKDMKDHECPNKIVKCQYCELSGEFKNIMTSTHQTDCPDFPINCPNGCKVSGIKRKTLNQHMQKCPLELVECSYSNVGCHERMYRKDYESHRTENSEKHLQLITESFSQLSTESERLKQENSRLRKENTPYHKLRVENSKLKTEITELKTEVTELKTEITELKKSYRSNSTDRSTK